MVMRAQLLIVLFFIGTYDPDNGVVVNKELLAWGNEDVLECDIIQRTCASEVGLVTHDIEDPGPIHLDMRPSGAMLVFLPPPARQVDGPE